MQKCNICGSSYSGSSMGGVGVCPSCDCGNPVEVSREKNKGINPVFSEVDSQNERDRYYTTDDLTANEVREPGEKLIAYVRELEAELARQCEHPAGGESIVECCRCGQKREFKHVFAPEIGVDKYMCWLCAGKSIRGLRSLLAQAEASLEAVRELYINFNLRVYAESRPSPQGSDDEFIRRLAMQLRALIDGSEDKGG